MRILERCFLRISASAVRWYCRQADVYPAKAFDQELSMTIDLKPALDVEQLDHRILREFDEMKNKQF